MYLPRSLISKLYTHLQSTRHALSQPVLLLVALEPDALCACRILTRLLKHDYIPHKIQPVAGYSDLERAARSLVQPMMESRGGSGGVVVCLGVGGMVDLGPLLGLEPDDGAIQYSGVEVWVLDSHRPWNLGNVFGGFPVEPEGPFQFHDRIPAGIDGGRIDRAYKPGKGGIVVFDDGDIDDDMLTEREAYKALMEMPDVDDGEEDDQGGGDDDDDDEYGQEGAEDEDEADQEARAQGGNSLLDSVPVRPGQKRKSWSDRDEEDSDDEDDRPRQRRRSNSSSPIPETPVRPRQRGLVSLVGRDESSSIAFSSDPQEPPRPPSSSSSSAAREPPAPSSRTLRRRFMRIRRDKESILRKYYGMGASFSEPISAMVYALASELGRVDNDLLWLTIVGVTSMELYGRSSAGIAVPVRQTVGGGRPTGWLGIRGARLRQELRDEVRRLNPPDVSPNGRVSSESSGVIPTTARSPEDTAIRLSPEPRFLLIRHWSLYDAMLHSPYLFSRLKTWSETGLKRLHKLLAKMGVSLVQCKQSYAHMDMVLKKELRAKLLKYGSLYNLDDMVPSVDTDGKDRGGAKDGWGFVRSWGWRATLSAQDVGVVIGALLEVGKHSTTDASAFARELRDHMDEEDEYDAQGQEWVGRFWEAYDALENIDALKDGLPTAQLLHRAIYRTGTSLINKKQIRHLRAFRMCIVKDGPDVPLFNHPAALTKLALWIGEALSEQEKDDNGRLSHGGRGTPLVVASLNEKRGVYVVVGTGGGGGPDTMYMHREAARQRQEKKAEMARQREQNRRNKQEIREARRAAAADEDGLGPESESEEEEEEEDDDDGDDESGSEDEDGNRDKGFGLNKFGSAFHQVVSETNARVRIDSFENSVVEVKKEDLQVFLETLSMKVVVG